MKSFTFNFSKVPEETCKSYRCSISVSTEDSNKVQVFKYHILHTKNNYTDRQSVAISWDLQYAMSGDQNAELEKEALDHAKKFLNI